MGPPNLGISLAPSQHCRKTEAKWIGNSELNRRQVTIRSLPTTFHTIAGRSFLRGFVVSKMTSPVSSDTMARYEKAEVDSHNPNDPKDQYSLADRAKLEKKLEKEEEIAAAQHKPPTAAAKEHGNKPSRGAQIDEQIENEETEYLKQKGKI